MSPYGSTFLWTECSKSLGYQVDLEPCAVGDTEVAVEGVLLEYWHRMCASQGLRLYMIQRRVFFKLQCVVSYRNSKRFPRLTVVGIEGLRLSFSLSLSLSLLGDARTYYAGCQLATAVGKQLLDVVGDNIFWSQLVTTVDSNWWHYRF